MARSQTYKAVSMMMREKRAYSSPRTNTTTGCSWHVSQDILMLTDSCDRQLREASSRHRAALELGGCHACHENNQRQNRFSTLRGIPLADRQQTHLRYRYSLIEPRRRRVQQLPQPQVLQLPRQCAEAHAAQEIGHAAAVVLRCCLGFVQQLRISQPHPFDGVICTEKTA